jgi:hypothetical protein
LQAVSHVAALVRLMRLRRSSAFELADYIETETATTWRRRLQNSKSPAHYTERM